MKPRRPDTRTETDFPELRHLSPPVRAWFRETFPDGPTPAQRLAWPRVANRENLLLVAPTGTGKTLAAFLVLVDRILRELLADHPRPPDDATRTPGVRVLYVSPLRSLGYDIERNLDAPLRAIAERLELPAPPVRVAVRTGDTPPAQRRKQRENPPHILVTTPESLALLLSQPEWNPLWTTLEHIVVDEIHALLPDKRGADLMISVERLAALAANDPRRLGLSATVRDPETVARFLVGPARTAAVAVAPAPPGAPELRIEVESLAEPGEAPHRGLAHRRLLRRVLEELPRNRSTILFANTRAYAERLTLDLRQALESSNNDPPRPIPPDAVAAHHSALDADLRRHVESRLKAGELRAVVTSTSLELGVDIGAADLSILVGLPGGVARCLQRVGRAGHNIHAPTRGLLLAANPAELVGALVTARAARDAALEPLRHVRSPLDVVAQQLVGMACNAETEIEAAWKLLKRAAPTAELQRADFEALLAHLAGELAAPAAAYEPEPGAPPRWTSPRIWKRLGWFGPRNRRVVRWFRQNVGTIHAEETVRVLVDSLEIGSLEAAYAERLQKGDRFVLDGRPLEFLRLESGLLHARATAAEPNLPLWTSDRLGLTNELALDVHRFRAELADRLRERPETARDWLLREYRARPRDAELVVELHQTQESLSEVPRTDRLLVELAPSESQSDPDLLLSFHAPLGRSACEALARGVGARLARRLRCDVKLAVSDLGWTLRLPPDLEPDRELPAIPEFEDLLDPDHFEADVLQGLDRGELVANRFKRVAATALMILKRPDGRRARVGGLNWVATKLYPVVKAANPDHPLVREARREVLEDLLDLPAALRWLRDRPPVRLRILPAPSPFALAWLMPGDSDRLAFESPARALERFRERLRLET